MATITEAPAAEEATDKPKKGKKKKLILILALVLVLAGAGYFFLGRGAKAPTKPPPPLPGTVLTLDPITLNLASGRYLKLGLALQFTEEGSVAGEGAPDLDGSKALDLAISQLSDRPVIELNSASAREKAKEKLVKAIEKAYDDKVMDVYFTEFVMQ
jgi:flagellar FliL protein